MSVDTWVSLPGEVKIDDVAAVIAILLGVKKIVTDLSTLNHYPQVKEPTKSCSVSVNGISFEASDSCPECCTINIEGVENVFGGGWWFFYHFQSDNGNYRLMGGASRAARIALHRRLVDFFGGTVDYQDCDSKEVDYRRKPPAWLLGKYSDRKFHALQIAKWKLAPITQAEVDAREQFASYKVY